MAEEQVQQDFRPDLVAKLKDGALLYIGIAMTSPYTAGAFHEVGA